MKYTFPAVFSIYIFANFFLSCANPVMPKGGPPDETAPQLILEESTRNFQTNFQKQKIELTFDEWIQLKDQFTQIVVSPPTEFRTEVKLKKRTIEFEFNEEEVLREEATYVINFGESIQDLTEGNPAEMRFVFSTGDYIDSLKISGNVIDAFTGEPVKDALVMLYENTADSVVRTERPFYFGKTDKSGNFLIENVKSDTFKCATLIDQNLNYLFDNESERFGFLDTTVLISDSTQPNITLLMFDEEKQLFLIEEEQENYGLMKLFFNQDPLDLLIEYDSLDQYVHFENDKDTIKVWYHFEAEQEWNLYIHRDTTIDTILVESGLKAEFLESNKLKKIKEKRKSIPPLNPIEPLNLFFNHPLLSFDTTGIKVYEDSIKTKVYTTLSIDSINHRQLNFDFPWKEGLNYELEILPGKITDRFGLMNEDTIVQKFQVALSKNFGTIVLRVLDLNQETNYVAKLLIGNEVIKDFQISQVGSFEVTLNALPAGKYSVEVIEDLDGNGRWTTGNYDLKRQPERLMTKELEELRENWDLDAEVSVKKLDDLKKASAAPSNSPPPGTDRRPPRN